MVEKISNTQQPLIERLKSMGIIFYIVAGKPSFAAKKNENLPCVLVTSIPKAGTYLIAAYLEKLGLVNCHVHLSEGGFTDYRTKTNAQMRSKDYMNYQKFLPIEDSVQLILLGQFIVGHLPYSKIVINSIQRTPTLFLTRELRLTFISFMRFYLSTGRRGNGTREWREQEKNTKKMVLFLQQQAKSVIGYITPMLSWINDPDVLLVRFEEIRDKTKKYPLAHKIAQSAGIDISEKEACSILDSCLLTDTKTFSGKYSTLEEYWSETAESIFVDLGGIEMNRKLGYES